MTERTQNGAARSIKMTILNWRQLVTVRRPIWSTQISSHCRQVHRNRSPTFDFRIGNKEHPHCAKLKLANKLVAIQSSTRRLLVSVFELAVCASCLNFTCSLSQVVEFFLRYSSLGSFELPTLTQTHARIEISGRSCRRGLLFMCACGRRMVDSFSVNHLSARAGCYF